MAQSLVIENFRSFKGSHELRLRKLNILVGNNSSGKSSLLAAIATCFSHEFPAPAVLHREPFHFGSFRSLANDGSKSFKLGLMEQKRKYKVLRVAEYCEYKDTAVLKKVIFEVDGLAMVAINRFRKNIYNYDIIYDSESEDNVSNKRLTKDDMFMFSIGETFQYLKYFVPEMVSKKYRDDFRTALGTLEIAGCNILAPIRSKPQRLYDGTEMARDSEGSHVPYMLKNLLDSNSNSSKQALNFINEFGRSAGLFDSIVSSGRKLRGGSIFELLVSKDGKERTLLDVGYGVSQILPILYESALTIDQNVFLVEQPEVHLHPQVQATLGNLFVELSAKGPTVVVETHSDYLLDRIRVLIKNDRVRANDVNVVYLENQSGESRIHYVEIDDQGQFVDPPSGFRDFFFNEQLELLGIV